MVDHAFREAIIGSPATVRGGIESFVKRTGIDELMINTAMFDHTARVRSLEIVAIR